MSAPEIHEFNILGHPISLEVHAERELVSEIIRNEGAYSRNDIEMMGRILNPGDVFIDAGANIGWHTVIGAKLVGPKGRVLAFEPEPKNASLLRRNVEHNSLTNVEVIEEALTSKPGTLMLHLSEGNFGDHILALEQRTGRATTEVKCTTIDEALAKRGVHAKQLALVKFDIQGSEVDALKGMRMTLSQHRPPLILEYSPKHLRAVGRSFFDVLSFIDLNGYFPSMIDDEKHEPSAKILHPLTVEQLLEITQKLFQSPVDQGVDLFLEFPNG
ncbi:MAG: FkbM family methyltransferase [Bdellovibrionota bacterium]